MNWGCVWQISKYFLKTSITILMKLWLSHPALWKKNTRDDCFQLMWAFGNPYEATLNLRTRAERISFMFLFHLTLILQKATSLCTPELRHWEKPCVSVRVRWSGTESYITPVSHAVLQMCLHVRPHTHTQKLSLLHSHSDKKHKKNSVSQYPYRSATTHTRTNTFHTHSSIWVNCGKERCSGLSHPSPPMEKNV